MVQAAKTRTELKVAPRAVLGKKVKVLRRQGVTPANIYGSHVESQSIQVSTEELRRILAEHSAVRGLWLTTRRLLRCHPWGGHGWDPVPEGKHH